MADIPIGIYLSGGIDSSVIAGVVAHLIKQQGEKLGNAEELERMCCFSIAFDEDSGYDESSEFSKDNQRFVAPLTHLAGIADETARWLDVDLYKKRMNEGELARYFKDAVYHTEHHWGELNFVGKFAVSELTRDKGIKVVLTGEGADEIFGGYRLYVPDYARESDIAWPQSIVDLPEPKRQELHEEQEQTYVKFLDAFGSDSTNRGDNVTMRQVNTSLVNSMASIFNFGLWATWTSCYGMCDPRETIAANVDGCIRDKMASSWHPLHSSLYLWSKGHIANIALSCLGDRAEMAHSIKARTPFLDHKLHRVRQRSAS